MNRLDLATREGAESFVEKALGDLKKGFKVDGMVPMMFHLFCTRGASGFSLKPGQIGLQTITVPRLPEGSKDDIAEVVKQRILDFRAIGVVFISECWILSGEGAQNLSPGQSIESHPRRVEGVHVALEHIRTFGIWTAFIARDSRGVGTLGPFKRRQDYTETRGRFAHLLHKERFA